ncbi:MAG: hypothetical protein K6G40_05165 [Eubacterium sp.]|nr:hypothetical protein [Eubacterium sp.]
MEYTRYDEPEPKRDINRGNFFETAAFCCGLISIFSCMVFFISFIFGSLGITFALLSRTDKLPLRRKPKKGLLLSIIGMAGSLAIFIIMLMAVVKSMGGWDALIQEYMRYYNELYGDSYEYVESIRIGLLGL